MPIAIVLSQVFFGIVTFVISTFLVLLVLVQRGRGGGLTGALGGPGGQSAFGTKAGDVFTKITIVTAALWIFFCALGVYWMQQGSLPLGDSSGSNQPVLDIGRGSDVPSVPESESIGNTPGLGASPTTSAPNTPSGAAPSSTPAPNDSLNPTNPAGNVGPILTPPNAAAVPAPGTATPADSSPKPPAVENPTATGSEPPTAEVTPQTNIDK